MAQLHPVTPIAERGRGEDGMAIVVSMVVCFVVFSLGATWIGISMHQVGASAKEKLRETARNAAEAGLNLGMSQLAANQAYTGSLSQQLPGAEFEVTVIKTGTSDDDPGRYIIAKGYAPSKAHPRRVARRLEQQVQLIPTDSFRYALFSAPGGITGVNKPTVVGDVYSSTDLTLSNHATVTGGVTSLGSVTTANNTSIAGDVRAGGNVTLDNANTTVLGNVYSNGNVALTGHVKGSVQAAGTITGSGSIDGSKAQGSPPVPPAGQTLPTFEFLESNYPDQVITHYANATAFKNYWSNPVNMNAISGVHYVECPVGGIDCAVNFGNQPAGQLKLAGDTTIVVNGPVTISKDITSTLPVTLTIVSTATTGVAITMTTQTTLPDNIKMVLFAHDAPVKFVNLKHFKGTVYANGIQLDQQFQLTFTPVAVPGFEFGVSSSHHYAIEAGAFREVPFS